MRLDDLQASKLVSNGSIEASRGSLTEFVLVFEQRKQADAFERQLHATRDFFTALSHVIAHGARWGLRYAMMRTR
jgi:hypothetical protein